MATENLKLSELDAVTSAISSDLHYISRSGASKKITWANLIAGIEGGGGGGSDIPFIVADPPSGGDDRAALQTKLDLAAGGTFVIGTGAVETYLVTPTLATGDAGTSIGAMVVPSHTNVMILPGVTIKAQATLWRQRGVFECTDVENVRFYGGGKIDGDRANTQTLSIGAFGVRIVDSTKIAIHDLTIVGFPGSTASGGSGGDAIYVRALTSDTSASNIVIERNLLDNNLRQGISVVRGTNIRIAFNTIKNTAGTDPGKGIDLEPNASGSVIDNILILGNHFYNNHGAVTLATSTEYPRHVTIGFNTIVDELGSAIVMIGEDHTIIGNTIRNNIVMSSGYLIQIAGNSKRTKVIGNTLIGAGAGGGQELALLRFNQTVSDILVQGNTFNTAYRYAIAVNSATATNTMKRLSITGNSFFNCNTGGALPLGNIVVEKDVLNTISDLVITNNIFTDDRGAGAVAYAVYLDDAITAAEQQTWRIYGNSITGTLTGKYGAWTAGYTPADYFHPVIATASLVAGAAGEDNKVLIEDGGAGVANLVIYKGGQRFKVALAVG